MRILLTVAVWGRKYAKTLVESSIASQLSPKNIPHLTAEHSVTYHIATTRDDGAWLRAQPEIRTLSRHCQIDWDFMEDRGYDPGVIPVGPEGAKYSFLNLLQNAAIEKSLQYDAISFNYADFVWSDGSLTNAFRMLTEGSDIILGFCLPVDQGRGKRALRRFRSYGDEGAILTLPPRAAASLAVENLHREARLRFWNGERFSSTPTYLIWPVGTDGLIIRAYHQTILAMRVMHDHPAYRQGIQGASLDGHFTAFLAEGAKLRHATNSDEIIVFSLFSTPESSRLPRRVTRDDALKKALWTLTERQRRHAEIPMEIRCKYAGPARWDEVARDSLEVVQKFHRVTGFDAERFDQQNKNERVQQRAARWVTDKPPDRRRPRSFFLLWFITLCYRRVVSPLINSHVGSLAKMALGPSGRALIRSARQKMARRMQAGPRP